MRLFSLLMMLVIIAFGVTFAILNAESVTVHYYIGTATLPLCVILLIAFSGGCLLSMVVSAFFMIRATLIQRGLQFRVRSLESEIQSLRSHHSEVQT